MTSQPPSLDTQNTSLKEAVRKKIRHALSAKSTNNFPNIDLASEVFEPIPDLQKEFIVNFRSAGGKYIPCTTDNFLERFTKLLAGQQYHTLLNTSTSLSEPLKQNNIFFYNSIDTNTPADAAIVLCDALIARSGSVVFSQIHSLYPSMRNLAADLIIVAFAHQLVPDIKTAIALQEKHFNKRVYDMTEIITPTQPSLINGQEMYSALEPRFILLLIDK